MLRELCYSNDMKKRYIIGIEKDIVENGQYGTGNLLMRKGSRNMQHIISDSSETAD